MITFNFAIRNPFNHAKFKHLGSTTGPLTENKAWEVEFMQYAYNLVELNINLNWKGEDHAGPSIEVQLFGFMIAARIYDHRHWNYEKNDWEVYEKD